MKILTRGALEEADSYLGVALFYLEKAERIYRNAHRSWRLHSYTASAVRDVKFVRDEAVKRWRDGYLVPPRTRKVLRIEQKERETMGSLDAPEDRGAGDSRGVVPRDGKQGNPR